MTEIVVTPLLSQDRARWAELWRLYLEFYDTSLPAETYDHAWNRLIAQESPIRGLGARLGDAAAPLVGIVHYLFHVSGLTFHRTSLATTLLQMPKSRARTSTNTPT